MLLCDCLATTIMKVRKFSKEKFYLSQGGNLGASLRLAKNIMVTGKKMPLMNYKRSFKEAVKIMSQKKLGIVVITKNRFIKGLTDEIKKRLNSSPNETNLEKLIRNYPLVINESMSASKALGVMSEKRLQVY